MANWECGQPGSPKVFLPENQDFLKLQKCFSRKKKFFFLERKETIKTTFGIFSKMVIFNFLKDLNPLLLVAPIFLIIHLVGFNTVTYRKSASFLVWKCLKSWTGVVVQLITLSTLTTVELNKIKVVVRLWQFKRCSKASNLSRNVNTSIVGVWRSNDEP